MITLFGLIGVIFLFIVLYKTSIKRQNWKCKMSKTFYAYSLLIAGYAIYIFIDHFFLKTKFEESGLAIGIFMYLLACQFLWNYKLSDQKET